MSNLRPSVFERGGLTPHYLVAREADQESRVARRVLRTDGVT
jgi:hypothetical protein